MAARLVERAGHSLRAMHGQPAGADARLEQRVQPARGILGRLRPARAGVLLRGPDPHGHHGLVSDRLLHRLRGPHRGRQRQAQAAPPQRRVLRPRRGRSDRAAHAQHGLLGNSRRAHLRRSVGAQPDLHLHWHCDAAADVELLHQRRRGAATVLQGACRRRGRGTAGVCDPPGACVRWNRAAADKPRRRRWLGQLQQQVDAKFPAIWADSVIICACHGANLLVEQPDQEPSGPGGFTKPVVTAAGDGGPGRGRVGSAVRVLVVCARAGGGRASCPASGIGVGLGRQPRRPGCNLVAGMSPTPRRPDFLRSLGNVDISTLLFCH
eukprot:m.43900 g.43900  ORF g.43900 m.43900 type:complete len:323 (+) comp5800_c0_seq2:932-1900(+)